MNRRVSEARFEYLWCEACGSLSLQNVPADLGRYYPASYYDVPATLADLDEQTDTERYKIALIRPWAPAGRLIEVGPAYGLFARVAQQAGYAVDTVEMDRRCCDFLRKVVGVGATCSDDVPSALGDMAPADVIAMWHVFEHLADPWDVLASAASRLRPGGIVVIATPNPESFQFRALGRRWSHLDAPRHLHLVSARALEAEARRLGLERVLLTSSDAGAVGWNSFGWATTLRNHFASPLARSMAYLAGRVLGKVLAPVERTAFRGSAYTIVLRRPLVSP